MNVVLIMHRDNGERRSFSLTRDLTIIGRREDADFRIPLSDVSRKHSRLIKDGNQLIIEDLGSANGTWHNGVRVHDAELQPGDHLQIGPVQFIVQIDGVPDEAELNNAPGVTNGAATDGFSDPLSLPDSNAAYIDTPQVEPMADVRTDPTEMLTEGAAVSFEAPSHHRPPSPAHGHSADTTTHINSDLFLDPDQPSDPNASDIIFEDINADSNAEAAEDVLIDFNAPEQSKTA
jgi:pSer/pThr/pTyr-binding forkhead associated (FHA) protein